MDVEGASAFTTPGSCAHRRIVSRDAFATVLHELNPGEARIVGNASPESQRPADTSPEARQVHADPAHFEILWDGVAAAVRALGPNPIAEQALASLHALTRLARADGSAAHRAWRYGSSPLDLDAVTCPTVSLSMAGGI